MPEEYRFTGGSVHRQYRSSGRRLREALYQQSNPMSRMD